MKMMVDSNIEQFTRWLSKTQKRRIPAAVVKALTFTAKDCQEDEFIKRQIPARFNSRVKWYVPGSDVGIRVKTANLKSGRYESSVYTEAYFGELQESGGVKIPFKGKGFLIPTANAPQYARKATGSEKLLKQAKVLRHGGKATGSPIMWMNSGKGGVFRRKGKKRLPIELIYNYRRTATIRPRFRFIKTAAAYGEREFQKKFIRIARKEIRKS